MEFADKLAINAEHGIHTLEHALHAMMAGLYHLALVLSGEIMEVIMAETTVGTMEANCQLAVPKSMHMDNVLLVTLDTT